MKSSPPTNLQSAATPPVPLDARLQSYSKAALAAAAVSALGTTDAAAQIVFSSPITSVTVNSGTLNATNSITVQMGVQTVDFLFLFGVDGSGNRGLEGQPWGAYQKILRSAGFDLQAASLSQFQLGYGFAFQAADGPGFVSQGPLSANQAFYLGLRHVANDHTYNGWLRFQIGPNIESVKVLTKDGVPGVYGAWSMGSIAVGEVVPLTIIAVPEPAQVATGLGLLALGAAGLREFRRRRKTDAA